MFLFLQTHRSCSWVWANISFLFCWSSGQRGTWNRVREHIKNLSPTFRLAGFSISLTAPLFFLFSLLQPNPASSYHTAVGSASSWPPLPRALPTLAWAPAECPAQLRSSGSALNRPGKAHLTAWERGVLVITLDSQSRRKWVLLRHLWCTGPTFLRAELDTCLPLNSDIRHVACKDQQSGWAVLFMQFKQRKDWILILHRV